MKQKTPIILFTYLFIYLFIYLFTLVDHLVLFSLCSCYSRRMYQMLKKPGAQNKAVCEKQSKQRELGDH